MKRILTIDIETYSSVDLSDCGLYKYIESDDYEILIVGYAFDHGEIKVIDLAQGEPLPEEFLEGLNDPSVVKVAHNAPFEREGFRRIGYPTPDYVWMDTAIMSANVGLPLKLEVVSKVLDLTDKKLDTGKALIRYFSKPCAPSKVNGGRTRNMPWDNPEKWEQYKYYNRFDVASEREIYYRLEKYPIPQMDRRLYLLDQKINRQGILIDTELASAALEGNDVYCEQLKQEVREITGISNPTSKAQIKEWIEKETGVVVESLTKKVIGDVKEQLKDYPKVIKVLNLNQKLSRTSIQKYATMLRCVNKDNRVRGTFQFYGAATGRWAGRLVQLQNFPQNHVEPLDWLRELVKARDWEAIGLLYGDVTMVLSQLLRTALIAPKGKIFAVADFSAIEARVIAWLAGEEWALEVFRGDGKIYEATGAKMFHVPIESITKGSDMRAKSKISVLALGYGGGISALIAMGGDKMGLSEEEMNDTVIRWRRANPHIVKMWSVLDKCAKETVRLHKKTVTPYRGVTFDYIDNFMTITIPTWPRTLYYYKPTIEDGQLMYEGLNSTTHTWCKIKTYGGRLAENIVQAIARDLLGNALMNLDAEGYIIDMHVHDEGITEVPYDGHEQEYYNRMVEIMKTPPEWAKDLPLNADGYLTTYYKKD